MKFAIVTPSFNRHRFLDATIESVVTQAGDFEIDYVIQQAGDNPEVERILGAWEARFADGSVAPRCRGIRFRVIRERDSGMYDGINRGFARAEGDVMAWINSDDLYHPGAFAAVRDVLERHSSVLWLVGIPNSINMAGTVAGCDPWPIAYSREFIARGLHRIENHRYRLNWIPQDSVFWRRELWTAAGGQLDTNLRYAADFALWCEFARHAELVRAGAMLGAYRFHGDQVTAEPKRYTDEIGRSPLPPAGWRLLALLRFATPLTERVIFGHRLTHPLLRLLGLRWEWVVGHSAVWSHERQAWELFLNPIF